MPCDIIAKGLWGQGTLQHRSREVRQRSGVFMSYIIHTRLRVMESDRLCGAKYLLQLRNCKHYEVGEVCLKRDIDLDFECAY